MDPLMTDAEVLLSSLLGEAPSIWLDDSSSNQDGGKHTIQAGEAETSDLFSELEQDSLLGNADPLPEWMSEKVSLTEWLDVADVKPSEILMESTMPVGLEKSDMGTIPDLPLPTMEESLRTEELLNTLIVDTRYAPQPPSPGEGLAPDLLALSPASTLFSEELSLSPSPTSPVSSSVGSPVSEMELEEQTTCTMTDLTTVNAIDLLQSIAPMSPTTSIDDEQSEKSTDLQNTESDTTLSTIDATELLQRILAAAALSPASSSGDIPMTLEGASVEVVVEQSEEDIPQPKSKARSKVKSVSNPVIKKTKKRDQNKRAATRYRQKKRGELGLLEDEREHLEKTNKGLHDKVDSMSREIKYLKDLLVEVYKVKGEIKVMRKK